jgi:hypothetical protein
LKIITELKEFLRLGYDSMKRKPAFTVQYYAENVGKSRKNTSLELTYCKHSCPLEKESVEYFLQENAPHFLSLHFFVYLMSYYT